MKTVKQICDAVGIRSGLGKMSSYFDSSDETMAYLINESANNLLRMNQWQKLRKTATITMTAATSYTLPTDIKYYVADTMNADGQESYIEYPTPTDTWWYFKSHQPTGIRFKVRQSNDQLEILNPDSGIDLLFEYISAYPVQSDGLTTPNKAEFTADTDVWVLDDELIILDLKWRYMSIKGIEGWEKEKMVFNDYFKLLKGQEGGASTLNFTGSSGVNLQVPYTDLYI